SSGDAVSVSCASASPQRCIVTQSLSSSSAEGTVSGTAALSAACGSRRPDPTTGPGSPVLLTPLCPATDFAPDCSFALTSSALTSGSSARMSAATPETIGEAKEQPCPSAEPPL